MRDKDGYVIVEGFARKEVTIQNILRAKIRSIQDLFKIDSNPIIVKKCVRMAMALQRAHIMNSGILN